MAGGVAAVTRGQSFLVRLPLSTGDVLWVGEEAVGDVKRRLLGFQAELDRVLFIRDPSPDRSQTTSLRQLSLLWPRWVIIDTWQHYLRLHGITDTAGAGRQGTLLGEIADLAREFEAAITISHHNQKSASGDAVGAYRDSTAIGATVDMIVAMSRGARARERRLTPYGRWPQDPLTIEWVSDGTYQIVRDAEVAVESSPASPCPPLTERVLLYLRRLEPQGRWPPARELARALESDGRQYGRLRSALDELRESGLVETGPPPDAAGRRNGYRLTTDGRARADAVRQAGDSPVAAHGARDGAERAARDGGGGGSRFRGSGLGMPRKRNAPTVSRDIRELTPQRHED